MVLDWPCWQWAFTMFTGWGNYYYQGSCVFINVYCVVPACKEAYSDQEGHGACSLGCNAQLPFAQRRQQQVCHELSHSTIAQIYKMHEMCNWSGFFLAGIPGSPAAIYHFLMDAAGKPCNHVVSSQKVWKTSLKACRRQVFRLGFFCTQKVLLQTISCLCYSNSYASYKHANKL